MQTIDVLRGMNQFTRNSRLHLGRALLCGLVISTRLAYCQQGTITGSVTDPSRAVVPQASITIVNPATGAKQSTTSNDSGRYVFASIPPGEYEMRAEKPGFQSVAREHVNINVATTIQIDIELKVGETKDAVTVTANSDLIQTSDASVGTIVGRKFVENIPLNGRSFQGLILLTPAVVTNTPQRTAGSGSSESDLSVNGQRTESNRYTVDGVSANNGAYNNGYGSSGNTGSLASVSALGTTQSIVSVDSLQEFKVQTSSYAAEYGRAPGGQFIFLTRSGTNEYHGTAFNFLRNDVLNATNWFNNSLGQPKAKERANDFGGVLGGPLTIPHVYSGRDRTFFFFSYEGMRNQQPSPATVTDVPSLSLRQQAPAALRPILEAFPLPNGMDLQNGFSEFIRTGSQPSQLDAASLRIDHAVANWLKLFYRFSDTTSFRTGRSAGVANQLQSVAYSPVSHTFGVTSVLSARTSNEFRLNYGTNTGRLTGAIDTIGGAHPVDLLTAAGVDPKANPSAYIYLSFNFPGYSASLGMYDPHQRQSQWNVTDTVSNVRGKHLLKAGIDYLQTMSTLHPYDPVVGFTFSSADAVVANRPSTVSYSTYGTAYPVFKNFSAFVQDEWRPLPRLTLSMGLRWELNPPFSVSAGELPYTVAGDLNNPRTYTLSQKNTPLYSTTYHNFAPRLGGSYLVHSRPGLETVIRAGGGVFFDTGQRISSNNFPTSPGFMVTKSYTNASWPLTSAQMNIPLSTSFTPPYGLVYGYERHIQLPYTLQWNTSIQQALGSGQALTITYAGAAGRRLQYRNQLNVSALNPAFTTVYAVRGNLTSDYNSFQAQFQRSLSRRLQALGSYTWSHGIDFGSHDRDFSYQRGDSDMDVRHSFSMALTSELPGQFQNRLARTVLSHWGLDGRISARSGYPVTLAGNTLIDPATNESYFGGLDVVPGQAVYLYGPQYPGGRSINPAAFSLPTGGGQVGNSPRNSVRGFGATQVDLTVRREFALSEKVRLQFRAESFNLLNHPSFGLVNTTYGNRQFGTATSTLNGSLGGLTAMFQQGGPRSMQLALKLVF